MYDDLILRLREAAKMSEALAVLLPHGEGNATAKLYNQAADAIEELSKPRWVPVAERLPQEWWPVLGLIQYHDEKEPPAQQVLWYLGNGHWRETWRGDMIESDVTHWMPLPQPPEEET